MIKLKEEVIVEKILDSISKSQKLYYDWNKDSIDSAPEYFLTVSILKDLATNLNSGSVTFEWNIGQVVKTKPRRGRPKKHFNKNGRFDIAIWRDDLTPWAFIEVKRNIWTKKSATNDLERIRDSLGLDRSHNLQVGFFATYIERERTKRKNEDTKVDHFVTKYEKDWIKDVFYDSDLTYKVHKRPIKKYTIEYDKKTTFHEAFQPICVVVRK